VAMPHYEHIVIARQDVSAQQAEEISASLTQIIADNGGQVVKTEYWGLRNLAYRIKKNRKGHYILLNIDAPWAAVAEMERQERINEDIIRFLTIRAEELNQGPSIMMQVKAAREERARREGGRPEGGRDRDRRDRDDDGVDMGVEA
jgi:small subunit ribosomal protein S6